LHVQDLKKIILSITVLGLLTVGAFVLLRGDREAASWSMVETVCADCHNDIDLAGDMSFAGMTPDSIDEHPEMFETVVRRLRGRFMPPPGVAQPSQAEIDALVSRIEQALDEGPENRVGYVRAQRLSRTEYAHAVKGLLGVEIDPVEYLPTEIEVEGFSNIASALSVSPSFIEQYVNVARTVAHLAVGEPVPKVAAAYFPPPAESQQSYVEGFPPGTRGGIRIDHNFPADGEYRLTIKNVGVGLYPNSLETEHTMVVLVDKNEVFRETVGGPEDLAFANRGGAPAHAEILSRFADIPLQIEAGMHEIIITYVERSRASSDEQIATRSDRSFSFAGAPRVPVINGGIDLVGPYNATGVARTSSRELIFACEPEVPERERECAERIAASLAERAFRRPATQADLDRIMPFYEEGRRGRGGFDEGIELVVMAVLASPDFLYRTIKPSAADTESYPLDDYELASRLSFFLWSQGPDDELLALAEAAELSEPATLDAQVHRMLADPRAEVLVSSFALAWLNLDDLEAVEPDSQIFAGEFSNALREDFAEESALFVKSILLEDEDVRALLTARHSFLNERLARHYGIDNVFGPQFRRVELADATRHGLLGKGAVLLRTSYGDRTSPVLRGAWVLEKLMGTPPTPPPPGVETDLTTPEGEEARTIRARLEEHRANPNCGACHGAIDPYGLALENFTVTGRWRDFDRDANSPIDATSELPGERPISGPIELREALLSREDQFVQALTEKLMMYALGRELEYFDMPEVRAVVDAAEAADNRFSAIVAGVVQSDAFRMQATTDDESQTVNVALGNTPGRATAGE
jgi:mono/diheme cytochrome c family protein